MKAQATTSILVTALTLLTSMMLAGAAIAQIRTGGPPTAATGAGTRVVPPGP